MHSKMLDEITYRCQSFNSAQPLTNSPPCACLKRELTDMLNSWRVHCILCTITSLFSLYMPFLLLIKSILSYLPVYLGLTYYSKDECCGLSLLSLASDQVHEGPYAQSLCPLRENNSSRSRWRPWGHTYRADQTTG